MKLKKSTKVGKLKYLLKQYFIFFFILNLASWKMALEKNILKLKFLIKLAQKIFLIKLKMVKILIYDDLSIKSIKCKHSEFDDDPEIIAYVQVKDLSNKNNDEVYVFNGWMFSSSPSINPFDHPVYDIWLMIVIKLFFLYQANLH